MNTHPPAISPPTAPTASAVDRARARIMATSLRVLLDRVPGARDALPQLAALESALLQQGLACLDAMPFQVLSRVCTQFATVQVSDSDAPLQDLQTRLLGALAAREGTREASPPDPRPNGPNGVRTLSPVVESFGGALMVAEISHSAFLEALGDQAQDYDR